MRFPWSLRRFWWSWIKQDILKVYYRLRYGIETAGWKNSMLPTYKRGKFVTVSRKGSYIDIKAEQEIYYKGAKVSQGSFIRLIPSAENHGIFYEYWVGGKLKGRLSLSMEDFVGLMDDQSEIGRLKDWAG